jgi:hypothetical protein
MLRQKRKVRIGKLSLSDIKQLGLFHCQSAYYLTEEKALPFARVSLVPCGIDAKEIPPHEEIWLEYRPTWKEYYVVEYFKNREVGMVKVDIEKAMELIKERLKQIKV